MTIQDDIFSKGRPRPGHLSCFFLRVVEGWLQHTITSLLTHFELPLAQNTSVCLQWGSESHNWVLEAQTNPCLYHAPPWVELAEVFLPRFCLLISPAVSTHGSLCVSRGAMDGTLPSDLISSRCGGERQAWREERQGLKRSWGLGF